MSASTGPELSPTKASIDEQGSPSTSLVGNPLTDTLSLFLVQMVLILVLVRLLAKTLSRLKQPPGPSVFGYIPGFESNLFPLTSLATLNIFAQVGLIFFVFFLGLELDPLLFKRNWKSAVPISLVSVLIPFSFGCAISPLIYNLEMREEGTSANRSVFALFIGTSLAFTAFPLLARILTSFRLLGTPFGEHVLAIAACDDVLAWCTLALTLSYASGSTAADGIYIALILIAYLVVMAYVVRPLLHILSKSVWCRQKRADTLNRDYVCVLLVMLSASAVWTEISGIHAFFGAFVAGLIVPKDDNVVELLAPKIELLVVEYFLPLYFAMSGLRTTLGALNSGEIWGYIILVTLVASVSKVTSVTLMTQLMTRVFEMDANFQLCALAINNSDVVKPVHANEEKKKAPSNDNVSDNWEEISTYSHEALKRPEHNDDDIEFGINGNTDVTDTSGAARDGLGSQQVNAWREIFARNRKCYSWRSCLSVGLCCNCTGLVTLIALNVGLDQNLIGQKVFSLMVLYALITTFATAPLFNWLFYVPNVLERQHVQSNQLAHEDDITQAKLNGSSKHNESIHGDHSGSKSFTSRGLIWLQRFLQGPPNPEIQFDTNAAPIHPIVHIENGSPMVPAHTSTLSASHPSVTPSDSVAPMHNHDRLISTDAISDGDGVYSNNLD